MKLIIASNNIHKIRELRNLLKSLPQLDILSLIDFPNYESPEEKGKTFEENAIKKATHAAKELQCMTLADDTGLVIPALKGAPGIFSARYAGSGASDKDNRKKLLLEMRDLKDHQRSGYFECAIAIASPEGLKKAVRAYCEGTITEEERGSQGFGYDSIFIKHEYSKTFAELEEETKNRISHRRKAFDKIFPTLESLNFT
ncbi:MAG: RdgB/HAM1 family non-canonical purine NTP pyrophosphatase [Chlamydiae bacterium]|nr:RdgB/HAM1 family non-canonical purine NTP pyrophosphatase [Chlamydiota bacterium]